ncbi:hypothetical protein Rsub_09410 [Raphidocelis subcapitata]|uniref:Transmembrane protein 50A n=1 Tax=Raphidocelis subcapitata TaxID=307507 RepID=A0A2V0PEM6_9CHLO|nr:hypothetical protein Rsub_09410 [Raphidocelis subcapitata]|eukprot:GBF96340.1 hypothetical protein Rsub_09410 [Raphidocelis subcapitata]
MEHIWAAVRPHGVLASGALCGAGWWIFTDAAVMASSQAAPFALRYALPALVATLGVLLLGAAGRPEEADSYSYGDEGEACRGKCVLFLAYVLAFGSIGAGTLLLALDKQAGVDLWPAASATISSTVLSASGLLLWLSRGAGDDGGYSLLG